MTVCGKDCGEMDLREEYLQDPCGTLSIPYWKSKVVKIPPQMRIVHGSAFDKAAFSAYRDEPYFRLFHSLKEIEEPDLDGFALRTAGAADIPLLVDTINRSYAGLSVTEAQLAGYTQTEVYDPALWVMVLDQTSGEVAGCGIAELDKELREGVLEWIQVLPAYRSRGVGRLMVNELLKRLSGKADFATVSGKVCDPTHPEGLYRRCGFTGNDVWHILTPL